MVNDCIFCKIVKGKIPSYKIYEDEEFVAFLDIFPKSEGHCLVIPKKHVEWVWDYDNLGKYFKIVGKIARHFRKVSQEKIIRSLILGWDVPHAHIHLVPGKKDNWGSKKQDKKVMEKIQERFKLSDPKNSRT